MHTKPWITKNLVIKIFTYIFFVLFVAFGLTYLSLQNTTGGHADDVLGSLLSPNASQVKSTEGRTNILLLGKGGLENESPDVTDTIILASVNFSNQKVSMISLPRDIWYEPMKIKINQLYKAGREANSKDPYALIKTEVKNITNLTIHYVSVVDYKGFRDVIDALGGIDVDVVKSFTDNKFPIPGKESDLCDGDPLFSCRYQTVEFKEGVEHMDGARALIFVRSRHSTDIEEGSDLGRARRQQLVLSSLKDSLLSPRVLTNLPLLTRIRQIGLSSIETDISLSEATTLVRLFSSGNYSLSSFVVDSRFLFSPPERTTYQRQFIFLPIGGSYTKLHEAIAAHLNE